jgi:hypothetical protein
MDNEKIVNYMFSHWKDSLEQIAALVDTGWDPEEAIAIVASKTFCILGKPGIGKSATAHDLTKRQTAYIQANPAILYRVRGIKPTKKQLEELKKAARAVKRLLDFSSLLPEDLNGLPFRDGLFTKYCPQEWVADLCGLLSFGVMVLDDLPASAPVMQVAGRQSALERRIHDHRFAPGVLIVVTGNRREDKAQASTLPSHFRNSVTMLKVEPSLDPWTKWYGQQPAHDPVVAAFLRWKPELLAQTPDKADKAGAFATPRSWASLGRQFKVAEANDCLFEVSSGLIGEPNATTFTGFVEVRKQMVDPRKVFDNPKKAMPRPQQSMDDASKRIAMTTALGEIAAHRSKNGKGAEKAEAPEKLLRALAHVTCGNNEFCAPGVQTFLDNQGSLVDLARVARTHRADPVIGKLLAHLKSSLLQGGK